MAYDVAEAANLAGLVGLLEGTDAQQVVTGLGIDTAWATNAAGADAAAVIAAGTTTVQTSYGPEQQVSAAAQAQASAIEATADQRELANMTLAQQIMEANLTSVWGQNIGTSQDAAIAAVQAAGQQFYQGFAAPAGDFVYGLGEDALDEWGLTSAFQSGVAFSADPNLQNFVNLVLNSGMIIEGPFPQSANIVDLGLQGMAALMQEGVVSDVIGSHASGDIGSACQVLHDALSGTMNLFSDDVLLQGQAFVQISDDAIQVGQNAFSLGADIFSGNVGAMGRDAEALFTNLGKGTLDFAQDLLGDFYLGVPVQDAGAALNDVVQVLGGMESDLMSNPDFSSAVNAIENQANALVGDIGSLLPSGVDNVISDVFNSAKSFLSGAASEAESIFDDAWDWITSL